MAKSLKKEEALTLRSQHCYDDNGLTIEEIENYWLTSLGLPKTSLGKTTINNKPISSQGASHKRLLYGTCKLSLSRVTVVQHIFGAIQQYGGIENPEWLG